MIQSRFFLYIIIRVFFIILNAIIFSLFLVRDMHYYMAISLLLLVVQGYYLIKYINNVNVKITNFLNAITYNDFTISFPDSAQENVTFRELYASLIKLRQNFQDLKIKQLTQERNYQEILDQVSVGVFTYDSKGHILFSNSAVKKMFNFPQLNHIKQLMRIDDNMYDTIQNLKPNEQKPIKFSNERESRQLSIKSNTIVVNKSKLKLIVIQDLSYELNTSETTTWLKLSKVLVHEIMNYITPITSISQSVIKQFAMQKSNPTDLATSQNIENGLNLIQNQGLELMEFVKSYRQIMNVPTPNKKIFNIKKLFKKVLLLIDQESLNKSTRISIQIENNDLTCFADEVLISQVLINLLKNSLQSLENQKDGEIILSAGERNDRVFIEIRDNGPGIPKEILNDIFVPFFTTKASGTGIGLSLSKQIMRLHEGILTVTSTPSKATVFILYF